MEKDYLLLKRAFASRTSGQWKEHAGGFDVMDMDKNVVAAIIGQDEAKSTICVEELHPASWHAQLIRSQRPRPDPPTGQCKPAPPSRLA
jgi:hypothetical protein